MNRATRRRLQRVGISKQDLATIKKANVKEAVKMYSAAVLLVLRDEWGFGKVRLERFIKQVDMLFDDIGDGWLSLEDCKETLLKECGIKI